MRTAEAARPHLGAGDTWAGRVLEGQLQQRYLATPDGLRDAAARIASAAGQLGCSNVMPASEHAAGAVAASVLLDPALRACDLASVRSGQVDKVLLVETVAVSGLRARRSAAAAHEAGAGWVGVAVLFPVLGTDAGQLPHALGLEEVDAVLCP